MKNHPRRGAAQGDGARNYRRHISYLLGAIANRLWTGGSRLCREGFDIGLTEWRLMWVLGHEAPMTAAAASQIMGADKAAVSRSIAELRDRGLITITNNPSDARERFIELSPEGWKLHRRIIVVSNERQRRLMAIYTPQELETLRELLCRLLDHIPEVDRAGAAFPLAAPLTRHDAAKPLNRRATSA